jgi:hypothetical protein
MRTLWSPRLTSLCPSRTPQGLKSTGAYLSRTLSYDGAEFRMEQLEVDPVFRCGLGGGPRVQVRAGRWTPCSGAGWECTYRAHACEGLGQTRVHLKPGHGPCPNWTCRSHSGPLSAARRVMYDRSCAFWNLLINLLRQLPGGRRKGLLWAAHQRFYRQMLMASKVSDSTGLRRDWVGARAHIFLSLFHCACAFVRAPQVKRCSELADEALREGMCVVIGLQVRLGN